MVPNHLHPFYLSQQLLVHYLQLPVYCYDVEVTTSLCSQKVNFHIFLLSNPQFA